ncbi:MAG: putative membrane protein [Bacteroidia bacterium]|jgi:uncharacterized membrane protein
MSTQLTGRLALLCYCVLLWQQGLDAWISNAPWFIWGIKIVPLLMFLPGMYRDNLRSYIWVCFVVQVYFLVLVQRIFVRPDDPLIITGLVAVVVLFITAMMYVRWRARDLRESECNPNTPMDAGE